MAETGKQDILLLTLVHPDFLPPVYATAQVLRDIGYNIHILTFDSFVPAHLEVGGNIEIESAGKHHGIGTAARIKLRRKYSARAKQLASKKPAAIIAFCAFSYLCALKIKGETSVIYSALEVADFILPVFLRSPLSNYNNLRALKNVCKADLVATPSVQRSAWLAGRCHLDFLPYTVLNTAYLPSKVEDRDHETFRRILPESFLNKKIVLYTGAVRDNLCTMELVQAFDMANEQGSALVVTGIKDNPYCNSIKEFVAGSKSKDRIQLLPFVTRAEMLALQANADIGVCLAKEYEDNVESKMMAPNKVGEYMAKGLYLLGVKNEYLMPFRMKGIASLAETTAPADVSIAIKDALAAVQDNAYKQTINSFVKEYFCMQQQLKPVINFLQKLSK
jgi:hypothetical protein